MMFVFEETLICYRRQNSILVVVVVVCMCKCMHVLCFLFLAENHIALEMAFPTEGKRDQHLLSTYQLL